MTDQTIELDRHRGKTAQKATELRRLLADVEANEKALRLRQEELESHLLAAPAATCIGADARTARCGTTTRVNAASVVLAAMPALAQTAKPAPAATAAPAGEDKYIGYYYPKPTTIENYTSAMQTIQLQPWPERVQSLDGPTDPLGYSHPFFGLFLSA